MKPLLRMDVEGIQARVRDIEAMADDDEAAHSTEDELHQTVLRWFAAFAPEPWNEMAAAALETTKIEFSRWCA